MINDLIIAQFKWKMMLSTKCCRATVVKKTNPRQILTTRCTSNGPRSMHIHTMVCMCDIYIYMYRVLANVYIYIYIINIYIYYIYVYTHTLFIYIYIYIANIDHPTTYTHLCMPLNVHLHLWAMATIAPSCCTTEAWENHPHRVAPTKHRASHSGPHRKQRAILGSAPYFRSRNTRSASHLLLLYIKYTPRTCLKMGWPCISWSRKSSK